MGKVDFPEPLLPFPLKVEQGPHGPIRVYDIPQDQKAAVLEKLYPFRPVPLLGEEMEDIHTEKTFKVKDFAVLREGGMNALVSPFYLEGGGSVIDWIPVEDDE